VNPAEKGARHLLRLTLLLALLPLLLMLIGAVGTKLGWWGWKFGFGMLTVRLASGLAFVGVLAGLTALYVAAFAGFRRLWPWAVASLVLPLAVVGGFMGLKQTAQRFPGHDIATDWEQPLAFSPRMMAVRGAQANPVHADPRSVWNNPAVENWIDRRAESVNARICPAARAVLLPVPPAEAYARAMAAVRDAKLAVMTDDPATGVLEATETSFWFEFKDDVVLRVRPEGQGSRIDLRSVSRVGGSDLGANCDRVGGLAARLGEGSAAR
jgi:fatty-acyl-CoA synthase